MQSTHPAQLLFQALVQCKVANLKVFCLPHGTNYVCIREWSARKTVFAIWNMVGIHPLQKYLQLASGSAKSRATLLTLAQWTPPSTSEFPPLRRSSGIRPLVRNRIKFYTNVRPVAQELKRHVANGTQK